jgi:hypothetical protein
VKSIVGPLDGGKSDVGRFVASDGLENHNAFQIEILWRVIGLDKASCQYEKAAGIQPKRGHKATRFILHISALCP